MHGGTRERIRHGRGRRVKVVDDGQMYALLGAIKGNDHVGVEGEAGDRQFERQGHEHLRRVVDLERGQDRQVDIGRVRKMQ